MNAKELREKLEQVDDGDIILVEYPDMGEESGYSHTDEVEVDFRKNTVVIVAD